MEVIPQNNTSLELTISFPSFGINDHEEGYGAIKDLDINQIPTKGYEEEEEEEISNGGKRVTRKKLRLSKQQSRILEETFTKNHTLNPKQKETLAMELKLRPRQVEVWFQNRRARSKLKQTEMECEYLKRWFGSLTQHNMRLHKEVEELRETLKMVHQPTVLSAQLFRRASTLSVCPRCDHFTTTFTTDHTTLDSYN